MREEIVERLFAEQLASDEAGRIGERARYRCEYCGLDILGSADNYKMWENDHIVPRSQGGTDDLDNLALSCLICNQKFKGSWNPTKVAGMNATRAELIEAVRVHVSEKRTATLNKVNRFRQIVSGRREQQGSQG